MKTINRIKLACVDDNRELLKSLNEALLEYTEVEVLFTACNENQFFNHVLISGKPEVVLMDIEMGDENGIELTRKINTSWPEVKVLMLTVCEDAEMIFNAILAGASGYLLKGEKPVKIIQAIEDVREGRIPMSPIIAAKALQWMRSRQDGEQKISPQKFGISARELQILELVATGINYRTIAEQLFISPKTVRNHIENILSKLNVHSRMEAVSFARNKNWLS